MSLRPPTREELEREPTREELAEIKEATKDWDMGTWRRYLDYASDRNNEWQGVPVPVPEMPLRLHDSHPMAELYRHIDGVEMQVLVGGPDLEDGETEHQVNHWYSRRRHSDVYVYRRRPSGKAFAVELPRAPDRSMDRLYFALNTLGASDAWEVSAEAKAMEKLQSMVSERQMRLYVLTGSFLETSPRSDLTYFFRRSRPTVVLTPRWPWWRRPLDEMKVLAVLCLHPVGFYERSWAGCMCPTDDVIAHLLLMRGDEAEFWRQANQHDAASPEAGL